MTQQRIHEIEAYNLIADRARKMFSTEKAFMGVKIHGKNVEVEIFKGMGGRYSIHMSVNFRQIEPADKIHSFQAGCWADTLELALSRAMKGLLAQMEE